MINKKAFTMTEIILTIAIIGIVAMLSIPTMTKDIQKTKYITGAKKAYADFNYVLKKIAADKECESDLKCTGLFASGTNNKTLGDEIIKYFKFYKNCDIQTNQNCWATSTNDNFDNSSATNTNFDGLNTYYKFITVDGISFAIHNYTTDYAPDCANNGSTGDLGSNSYMTQVCGIVYIDVNGPKSPNAKGKDTFIFFITNGKGAMLYPAGGIDDNINEDGSGNNNYWNDGGRNYCFASTSKDGKYCTGRFFEKGWDIDYL